MTKELGPPDTVLELKTLGFQLLKGVSNNVDVYCLLFEALLKAR